LVVIFPSKNHVKEVNLKTLLRMAMMYCGSWTTSLLYEATKATFVLFFLFGLEDVPVRGHAGKNIYHLLEIVTITQENLIVITQNMYTI